MSYAEFWARLDREDYVPTEDARAQRDAMAAIARDIPDPREMARALPLAVCEALLAAERDTTLQHRGFWRVRYATPEPVLADLVSWGLVYVGDPLLSVQGRAVRAALLEPDA